MLQRENNHHDSLAGKGQNGNDCSLIIQIPRQLFYCHLVINELPALTAAFNWCGSEKVENSSVSSSEISRPSFYHPRVCFQTFFPRLYQPCNKIGEALLVLNSVCSMTTTHGMKSVIKYPRQLRAEQKDLQQMVRQQQYRVALMMVFRRKAKYYLDGC